MDKQKWLIAGLSLVMAASLGVGISACGGEQEHTHTYDAWDHSETQHWKYCDEHGDDKSNIDETTRADHDFSSGDCVCGAKKPATPPPAPTEQIYIVGNLSRYSTKWPGLGGTVTGCLRLNYDAEAAEWSLTLRLGGYKEDGYTTSENFKLFDSVSKKYYPDGVNNNWTVGGDKDGTCHKASGEYKISWKKGDTDVTFTLLEHKHDYNVIKKDDTQHWSLWWLGDDEKEGSRVDHIWENDQDEKCDVCGQTRHVHHFTQQNKDATRHWMECPTEGYIDESTVENHTYDPATGKCTCGAVKSDDCTHDEIVFDFTADTLPKGVADGGTIQAKCEKCGAAVPVSYDKYAEFAYAIDSREAKPPVVIENDTKYYTKITHATGSDYGGAYLGYKIEKAGSLTVTMDIVCSWERGVVGTSDLVLDFLAVNDIPLETGTTWGDFGWGPVYGGRWSGTTIEKWKQQIVLDPALGSAFHSMTITFKEEDVGKNLYFTVNTKTGKNLQNSAFLFDVTFAPAAATESAPAEVAMLPGKKD